MSKMSILVVVAVLALGACFGSMFAATHADKVPFDATHIPGGSGWQCFDRVKNRRSDTLCYRSMEDCKTQQYEDHRSPDTQSVSDCEPRPQAYCYFIYREKTDGLIKDPSALGYKPACFGTQAQCEHIHDNWVANPPYGVTKISECGRP